MNRVRWNPWEDISSINDRIDSIFEDSFPRSHDIDTEDSPGMWNPVVDVYETEGSIVIHAELPGLKKEDITVEIKGNVVTLKGEKCFCTDMSDEDCRSRERCFGRFHRTFTVPTAIDFKTCRAVFEDGVLQLSIPRAEVERPRQISITVD